MTDEFDPEEDADDENMGDKILMDPDLWIQVLLSYKGDEREWRKLVEQVSRKAGMIPEKGELILNSLLEILLKLTRSN
jgi:hypothetical protein